MGPILGSKFFDKISQSLLILLLPREPNIYNSVEKYFWSENNENLNSTSDTTPL